MEGEWAESKFWNNKRVFITGHTGFKGSWLTLWLQKLGADVYGYSLAAPTNPSLYDLACVGDHMTSTIGDIRDYSALTHAIQQAKPQIVFHLAAQPLVRESYRNPVGTFAVNVMGTVHLLEAVRHTEGVRVIVNVTSDKCYENKEWLWGYRETDPIGGYDPYSASKGCAELVTVAFRNSYFQDGKPQVEIASARAGNVIGGGDWAEDRLIPDIIRSILQGKSVSIRKPNAVRPWQHVLEPLNGYLLLAERLWNDGQVFSEAWNFGPSNEHVVSVAALTERLLKMWGNDVAWLDDPLKHLHETNELKLDSTKAIKKLGWQPRLSLEETLGWVIEWYQAYAKQMDMRDITLQQLNRFECFH